MDERWPCGQNRYGLGVGNEDTILFDSCNVFLLFALSATHGTGIGVGNLAALVTKLKFVSGKGEVSK